MEWWRSILVRYYVHDFGLVEARRLSQLPWRRRWRRVSRLLYGRWPATPAGRQLHIERVAEPVAELTRLSERDIRKRIGSLDQAERTIERANASARFAFERAKIARECRTGAMERGLAPWWVSWLKRKANQAEIDFVAARERARWTDEVLQQYVVLIEVSDLVDNLGRVTQRMRKERCPDVVD